MYFSVVFQDSLSKHMSPEPVWPSWLPWVLCSFATLPALREEEVNSVVEREEGMAHGRVMVTQPSKQESSAKAPASDLYTVLSLHITQWHACS